MKNPKLYISAVIAVIIIATVCAGCTSIGTIKDNTSTDESGFIMESIDVPQDILEAAKSEVERIFEMHREDFPDYGYVNWRIENLKYSYTYENLDGMRLVIYQMNYEFLSESPKNVVLAGGMYITTDNWFMPNYPNSTYLIFRQDSDKLIFLTSIMENDCEPGMQIFTDDLHRVLSTYQTDISIVGDMY